MDIIERLRVRVKATAGNVLFPGDPGIEDPLLADVIVEIERLRALLATITARCDEWKPGTSEPDPVRPGKWREFNTLAHGNTIIHGIVALIKKGGDE
jgi:hypothetical protein